MNKTLAIYARADENDLKALERVAKHLKRKEADAVRFLIHQADEQIKQEKALMRQPAPLESGCGGD